MHALVAGEPVHLVAVYGAVDNEHDLERGRGTRERASCELHDVRASFQAGGQEAAADEDLGARRHVSKSWCKRVSVCLSNV